MSVERNSDGSITIRDNNSVTAIGQVITVSINRQEEHFNHWVEECTKLVTPCANTFKATEKHFIDHCDALPLKEDDRRMKHFQYSVIMNHSVDILGYKPSEFSFEMADEEIEKWHKQQKEIRNAPSKQFGLIIRGYYLPHTERNAIYYKQVQKKMEEIFCHEKQKEIKNREASCQQPTQIKQQDICLFFEEITEHCQATGGGEDLMQQLIVFRGVTAEDIELRSPRFLGYISTLREMGRLPGFQNK